MSLPRWPPRAGPHRSCVSTPATRCTTLRVWRPSNTSIGARLARLGPAMRREPGSRRDPSRRLVAPPLQCFSRLHGVLAFAEADSRMTDDPYHEFEEANVGLLSPMQFSLRVDENSKLMLIFRWAQAKLRSYIVSSQSFRISLWQEYIGRHPCS